MAIVVLLLWAFTASAGFFVLVRSNLARPGPAPAQAPAPSPVPTPAAAASVTDAGPPTRSEIRQATRTRFDPESLTASRAAPLVPGARALLEFMHPACGIIGLGFWLGFTLVHARLFGWIAVGLITVTAILGLTWFAASARAARRAASDRGADPDRGAGNAGAPAPSFSGRLVALHGGAAALTFVLAVLSALVLKS
jgi:hypothetical protein